MKNNLSLKRVLLLLLTVVFMLGGALTSVKISMAYGDDSYSDTGETITGTLITLDSDANAYDSPSDSANVVMTFKAGDPVFYTGDQDGYMVIFYAGNLLYLKGSDVSQEAIEASEAAAAETAEAISEEFEKNAQIDVTFIDSYLKQQRIQKNAFIWRIVIGVLVAAIIAISIIIAVRNAKNETVNAQNDSDDNQDSDN